MTPVVPAAMASFPDAFGYAPGLLAHGFLFIAGQLGRDDALRVIEDPEAQITRAWENVLAVLAEAGCAVTDIVDVTTFHVGLREHLALYKQVRDRVMRGHQPPWTAIGVAELSRPGLLVEIKCIARAPRS
ncbi:RidA family protein [Falsiroseomonas oryzae]|uniref:RidA family protein n=1 Tax=Falsiroseomonas oryzae TaxID=2766473 RepID=UPI0022EB5EB4|nr:RidA family protein [Roseomonas sp. MO-31]